MIFKIRTKFSSIFPHIGSERPAPTPERLATGKVPQRDQRPEDRDHSLRFNAAQVSGVRSDQTAGTAPVLPSPAGERPDCRVHSRQILSGQVQDEVEVCPLAVLAGKVVPRLGIPGKMASSGVLGNSRYFFRGKTGAGEREKSHRKFRAKTQGIFTTKRSI